MKKYLTMLIALLLLLAASSTAWAANLYDTYGPMDEWDEQTWAVYESWDEAQHEEYWLGQEDAYMREQAIQNRADKLAMGCPDPDGVNVKLNEDFLTIPNHKPLAEGGIVFLPLRDFLTAAGIKAEITYDAATQTATLKLADGRSHGFSATMPESPKMEDDYWQYFNPTPEGRMAEGVMYVRDQALADFLGWDRSFDYNYQIVYMIDPEPLIAEIDSHFTIINRLLVGLGQPDITNDAYKFTGHVNLAATLYGDKGGDTASATISYSGVSQGLDASGKLALKLDVNQIKDTLLSGMDEADWAMLKLVSAGQAEAIVNSEQGLLYVQSNLLPLYDSRLGAKDWLTFSSFTEEELLAARNLMWEQLGGLSLGRLIYDSAYGYYYGSRDTYANALALAELFQSILGDGSFKTERRGGYDVYTLKPDQAKLQKTLAEADFALPGSDIVGYIFGYYGYYDDEQPADLDYELVFREQDGKLADLSLSAAASAKGYVPMSYTLNLSYNERGAEGVFELKGRYGGKLSLSFDYTLSPTTEKPATAPPAGSKLISEEELYNRQPADYYYY